MTDALAEPLLQIQLFHGLTGEQLNAIARRADRVVFRPDEMLIEDGADADSALLIVAGEAVRVVGSGEKERGEPVPVGALLAEMGMLIETTHSATVVARTAVRALRIGREAMHELMACDPDLAQHFVTRIAARLTTLMNTLREVDGALLASTRALPAPRLDQHGPTATTH
jgi:CRP-like cAMP-binding protein